MKKTRIRPDRYEQKLPRIGSNVVIYTNAIVGGPVIIGENVIIGGNCVCTHDVEPNTMVFLACQKSHKQIEVIPGSYREI